MSHLRVVLLHWGIVSFLTWTQVMAGAILTGMWIIASNHNTIQFA